MSGDSFTELAAQMVELRELIRQAHEVNKDMRALLKELKAAKADAGKWMLSHMEEFAARYKATADAAAAIMGQHIDEAEQTMVARLTSALQHAAANAMPPDTSLADLREWAIGEAERATQYADLVMSKEREQMDEQQAAMAARKQARADFLHGKGVATRG